MINNNKKSSKHRIQIMYCQFKQPPMSNNEGIQQLIKLIGYKLIQ